MEATISGWEQVALPLVTAITHLPCSSSGQCSSAAFPRLHKLSGDVQLFSSLLCSLDPGWGRRASLSCCSVESTKLSFSPAKLVFFPMGRLTSPERACCLLHRSSLMQNKNLLIAYLSFKCPLPKQNRQLEPPSCAGIAAWQEAHSLKPSYSYAVPPQQQQDAQKKACPFGHYI